MLNIIKILIKADCIAWLNSYKFNKETWRKSILRGTGYLIFIVALSVLGLTLFSHLKINDASAHLVLNVINGFMLFAIIIVTKELMESSLKTLYEASDTLILHAAPVQPIAIFGYKFTHISAARLMTMLCFMGPPWMAYGTVFKLPWHFYVVLFPVSICLLLIIASYVSISMMVITRFFLSHGLLTIIKIIATTIGVSVGFLLSFTLFAGTDVFPLKRILLEFASTQNEGNPTNWLPHQWVGELLLSWTIPNSTLWVKLKWILYLIGLSVFSMGLTLVISNAIYQRGWENTRQLKTKRNQVPTDRNNTPSQLNGLVIAFGRGKVQSLMLKDLLIFIKHSGRVIVIVMLTIFLVVHIGVLLTGGISDDYATEMLTIQVLLYSLLITFGISCNGLRDEAKTWWMLKSAPVTPNLVFTSKFMTTLLCALIYAEFWLVISVFLLQIPTSNWMLILLIPFITLPVGCAVNTMIGTLPWMAELTNQPNPFLRVLTFTLTFFLNIVFVILPTIALYTLGLIVYIPTIIFLTIVFFICYRWGVKNLRKLLAEQV